MSCRFRNLTLCIPVFLLVGITISWANDEEVFDKEILTVLDRVCFECHEPGQSKGGVPFMEVLTTEEIRGMRSVWRSVASQLHNRTMPPLEDEQPTEEERERVVTWIREYLKKTAPLEGPYAGNVTARRLNRLEYNNTVRDLIGVDLKFHETLPAEGGAGEGFNNSGETLFLQPMLLERYLDAAQQIVDAAIVSPRRFQTVKARDMRPGNHPDGYPLKGKKDEAVALMTVYLEDDYDITLRLAKPAKPVKVELGIDGFPASELEFKPGEAKDGTSRGVEAR